MTPADIRKLTASAMQCSKCGADIVFVESGRTCFKGCLPIIQDYVTVRVSENRTEHVGDRELRKAWPDRIIAHDRTLKQRAKDIEGAF